MNKKQETANSGGNVPAKALTKKQIKNRKQAVLISLILVAAVAASFAIYQFAKPKPSMPVPGDPLVFHGTVLAIEDDNIYVEAEGQSFTRISVSVFDDTQFTFSNGTDATLADIKANQKITVTNYGLLVESYPAQTSAQKIVING